MSDQSLCVEPEIAATEMSAEIEEPVMEEPEVDSATEEEEIILEPVEITSDEIVFKYFSDEVINTEKLHSFIEDVRAKVTDRQVSVMITGHTCDIGSENDNLELGQNRADAIVREFVQAGFNQKFITGNSGGERNPLMPNDSETNRARNRRVEITIKTTDQ